MDEPVLGDDVAGVGAETGVEVEMSRMEERGGADADALRVGIGFVAVVVVFAGDGFVVFVRVGVGVGVGVVWSAEGCGVELCWEGLGGPDVVEREVAGEDVVAEGGEDEFF